MCIMCVVCVLCVCCMYYVYCVCIMCIVYVLYMLCVCYICCVCVLRIRVMYACCICALLCYNKNMFQNILIKRQLYFIKHNSKQNVRVYIMCVMCVYYIRCVCVLRIRIAYVYCCIMMKIYFEIC